MSRSFQCPPFPSVPLDSESGYWSGNIELDSASLTVSLYVDAALSDLVLRDATKRIANLASVRRNGLAAIAAEAELDPTICRDFFEFHLSEVPGCLPPTVRENPTSQGYVDALLLVGVGIHSDDTRAFQIWLDFSYGRQFSDELLSVKFAPDGSVFAVSHES